MPIVYREIAGALSVPAFLTLMVVLDTQEPATSYESPILLALLNTIFLCAIPLWLAYRASHSHRVTNDAGFVMVSAGLLSFGLSSFFAGWVMPMAGNPNPTVTLHNLGSFLAGICLLVGAHFFLVRLSNSASFALLNQKPRPIYVGIVILVSLSAILSFRGITPVFYDPLLGPTYLRQLVLCTAILMFSMAGLIFLELYAATKSAFAYWYGLGLWLIAIGLTCVLLQSGVGSLLGWTGRGAQYLGCLFLLYAFLQGQKEQTSNESAQTQGLWPSLEKSLSERTSILTRLNVSLEKEISQRKRTEEALRYSEGLFRAVVEGTTDAIYIKDPNGRYLMVNNATARFVGKDPQEIIAHDDTHLFPPDEARTVMNTDRHVLDHGEVATFEERVTTADGLQKTFFSTKGPVRDERGRVIGLFGIARDVTELMNAEAIARFRQFSIDRIQDEVYWINIDGQIIDANQAACTNTGYARDELLAFKVFDVDPVFTADQWQAHWQKLKEKGSLKFESFRKTRSGKLTPTEVVANYFEYNGQSYNCALVRDITERKHDESELRQSEQKFRSIFDNAADPILLISMDGHIRDANPEACRLYGYSRTEFIGKHGREFVQPDHINVFGDAVAAIKAGLRFSAESVDIRRDGMPFPIEVHIAPLTHRNEPVMLCFIRDITERRRLEEQVRQLAFYDPLTQLPNRRLLGDRLVQTIAANKRSGCHGALMFLDMDNFKPLNDTHGHEVGDALLVETAKRLRASVRESDTVSRLGGDEFVVLINELMVNKDQSASEAIHIAEKILDSLAEPYLLTSKRGVGAQQPIKHQCTASIGVALFANHASSSEDIMKRADTAMYKAKRAGGNQILLDDFSSCLWPPERTC